MKEWTPRLNASIFQVISVSMSEYEISALTRASDAVYEEYLDMITNDNRWVESITASTGDPQKIDYAFETWGSRLKELMLSYEANDSARGFTVAFKRSLWEHDRRCALCGSEIKNINDAHVDHVEHYWRGGKTIPENARLAHRTCNMSRPR